MVTRHRPRRTSPLHLPSAFDLFKPSKDLFIRHLDVFAILYVLPLIFWVHSWVSTPAHGGSFLVRSTDANSSWAFPSGYGAAFIGFSFIWFIFAMVTGTVIQIMLQRSQLDAAEDKMPSLGRAWQTVKSMGWQLLGLYVVMAVIIGIGFFLLIVPGLFMLRRYIFAPYIMLDKKCGIKEAMEESHHLGLRNTDAVWGLIGVSILIGLVGIVPFIGSLASFILGALYSIAPAMRYRQLKELV